MTPNELASFLSDHTPWSEGEVGNYIRRLREADVFPSFGQGTRPPPVSRECAAALIIALSVSPTAVRAPREFTKWYELKRCQTGHGNGGPLGSVREAILGVEAAAARQIDPATFGQKLTSLLTPCADNGQTSLTGTVNNISICQSRPLAVIAQEPAPAYYSENAAYLENKHAVKMDVMWSGKFLGQLAGKLAHVRDDDAI